MSKHRAPKDGKRDANEPGLVAVWRGINCVWIPQGPDAGFDGLLVAPNGKHIVEIKNPLRPWKLTDAEARRKAEVEALGQKYNIVQTDDDALRVAGK